MIESHTRCYLYKSTRDPNQRIYHRTHPDNTKDGNARWNTPNRDEAGYLTKMQWQDRSIKWAFSEGWMLESTTGETEALRC